MLNNFQLIVQWAFTSYVAENCVLSVFCIAA